MSVQFEQKSRLILNVGLACLDIVMVCHSYPEEDSDQRCISHEWRRGGNASNNSTVMREFHVPCEYFGSMSSDGGGKFLKQDLENHGILSEHCVFYDKCSCPTSVVLISAANGSRTIIHSNKDLPELTNENFKALDLQKYRWIHFEVRPTNDIKEMVRRIKEWNATQDYDKQITVSIEIEKPKPELAELLKHGDVLFISKDFARACGFSCMKSAVETLSDKLEVGCILVCPWGEDGACAKVRGGSTIVVPAYPPPKIVDTLGAGDVFVATAITCLANKYNVEQAILHACQVAGAKCGMYGFKGLHDLSPPMLL